MFEVRYKWNGEWFPVEVETRAEICHGEEQTDPSYVLGVGITIKPGSIPADAEEVYCFYHFDTGEDVEDNE